MPSEYGFNYTQAPNASTRPVRIFSSRPSNTLGVTLIEMVVVIAILAVGLTAVTQMLSRYTLSGSYTYDETKAIELAESLAGEIRSKRFDESSPVGGVPPCDGVSGASACTISANLGPEAGETSSPYTRVNFDDVDDYDGVDEGSGSATGHSLLDVAGNQRTGYQNFRVQIAVSYSGSVAPRSGALTDSKKVQLTVTQPNGEALDFTFHVANY
jgi:MSHA pilin protein MshD